MIYTPFIWPLLLAAILILGISFYARRFQSVPAARPFRTLMVLSAFWAMSYALVISTTILPVRVYLSALMWVPIALIPPTTLILALEYTGQPNRKLEPYLFIAPAIFILLAFTTSYHRLFRFDFHWDFSGPLPTLLFARGPGYWVSILYGYLLIALSAGILLGSLRAQTLSRGNTLVMLFGISIPLLTDLAYNLGFTPLPGLNLTPAMFILTGGFYAWALFRFRLFDVVPVARNMVVESIADPVIVLDTQNHIVDFNPAAQAACSLTAGLLGQTPEALSPDWAEAFRCCPQASIQNLEVTIGPPESGIPYDLNIAPILDRGSQLLGRLFMFHDIKDRKRVEKELRVSEEKFRMLINTTASGMFVYQIGRFALVNPAFLKLIECSPEEAESLDPLEIVHPDFREMVRSRAAARLQGEEMPSRYEVKFLTRKGNECWVDMSIGVITFDGQTSSLVTVLDVTSRKQAQAQMNQAMEELTRFNQAMVGREIRMIELKKEINKLLEESGQPPKYVIPD